MCEDDSFPQRDLASLVASKVYYHLGEFDESLTFALGAGKLFDPSSKTEFVDTIICTFPGSETDPFLSQVHRQVHRFETKGRKH